MKSLTAALVLIALMLGNAMTATPATAVQRLRPGWRDARERGHEIERWEDRKLERQRERRRERRREERQAAREAAAAATAASATVTSTPAPTATYTPTTTYQGALYISEAEAADAMRAAGFPESVIPYFISTIIPRESNFCATAVYPGHCGDVSLMVPGGPACSTFQLFPCPGPQVADPYVAARYAYSKYTSQGLSAWSTG